MCSSGGGSSGIWENKQCNFGQIHWSTGTGSVTYLSDKCWGDPRVFCCCCCCCFFFHFMTIYISHVHIIICPYFVSGQYRWSITSNLSITWITLHSWLDTGVAQKDITTKQGQWVQARAGLTYWALWMMVSDDHSLFGDLRQTRGSRTPLVGMV